MRGLLFVVIQQTNENAKGFRVFHARGNKSTLVLGLIPLLWDNLSPNDWAKPSAEWIQEANRRSNEIDNGDMSLRTWDEARELARRKAGIDD